MNAKDIKAMTGLYASLAMMGMLNTSLNNNSPREFELKDVGPVKKPIPAGCKQYTFFGITVIASNEKTAIKKCKKLSEK